MLQIKVSNVDALNDLSCELGVLAYLQQLAEADGSCICDSRATFAKTEVISYLSDLQYDAAMRLQELVTKDGFIEK